MGGKISVDNAYSAARRASARAAFPLKLEPGDRGPNETAKADTMAGSVNKVILIGNLGRDPEVRHTQNGDPIVHLNVATSESWRDRVSGERRERTEWHRVVIFNENLGKIAEQYLRKGSKV